MKVRIAMFRWARYPDWEALPGTEESRGKDVDFVQATPYVEIEFEDFTPEEMRMRRIAALKAQEVALLDKREKQSREHTAELERINVRLAELQAAAPSGAPEEHGEESPTLV